MPESNKSAPGDDVVEVEGRKAPVHMDVSWLVPADLAAIDALARLQLVAGRCGRSLRLHGADEGLVRLADLAGLRDALGVCGCHSPLTGPDEGSGEG